MINKIGVIFVAYNMEEYVKDSLYSWISLKNEGIKIAAVSIPFKEYRYKNILKDNTQSLLKDMLNKGDIDYLFTSPEFITEYEARDLALQVLLKDNCSLIILVDCDEFWTIKDINNTINFVNSNPLIAWFRSSFKNYVFDTQHYLAQPFTPPRIYRAQIGENKLKKMIFDNDIAFESKEGDLIPNDQLSNLTIPPFVAWVAHKSWLSNSYSREKIKYQESRKWLCSYRWNDITNQLEFDLSYYTINNAPLPEVVTES